MLIQSSGTRIQHWDVNHRQDEIDNSQWTRSSFMTERQIEKCLARDHLNLAKELLFERGLSKQDTRVFIDKLLQSNAVSILELVATMVSDESLPDSFVGYKGGQEVPF